MDFSGNDSNQHGGVSWLVTKDGRLYATGSVWGHNDTGAIAYGSQYNHFPFCSNGEQDFIRSWTRVWLNQASAGDDA